MPRLSHSVDARRADRWGCGDEFSWTVRNPFVSIWTPMRTVVVNGQPRLALDTPSARRLGADDGRHYSPVEQKGRRGR